jgi:hypothetical protein
MMTLEEIKNLVATTLRAHFSPAIVSDIRVFQEADSDGEPILRFQVIVDRSGPDLTADQVFFSTGVVRQALRAVNESRFPLLTFPSSDEVPGVAA